MSFVHTNAIHVRHNFRDIGTTVPFHVEYDPLYNSIFCITKHLFEMPFSPGNAQKAMKQQMTFNKISTSTSFPSTAARYFLPWNIEVILPKGPYLPCVSMAGRALLAGYHRYISVQIIFERLKWVEWNYNSFITCGISTNLLLNPKHLY